MTHIVAIANQKGGVGKTTTAINVSSSVAAAEKRALVVDMDPQANLTSGLGVDVSVNKGTIYNGLIEGVPIDELIAETDLPGLNVVPSERNLTGAEIELVDQPRPGVPSTGVSRSRSRGLRLHFHRLSALGSGC